MLHARRTPALAAAALLAACGGADPIDTTGRDARAEAIVADWIDAAGGADVWDDARSLRYTVTTVWYDPESGVERRRRPRFVWVRKLEDGFQVRVERQEAEGRYVQVWDGAAAWATLDGRRLDDTASAVVEMPHVAGDLTYWIGLPWKLRDPGVQLAMAEPADPLGALEAGGASHAEERVVVVSFGPGVGLSPGDRYWYHFGGDGADAFPRRVDFLKENLPDEARERTLWRDWQRSGRVTYVGERLYVDVAGRPERALLFSDVAFGESVDPELFAAPPLSGTSAAPAPE
jgi:hypothetical protein